MVKGFGFDGMVRVDSDGFASSIWVFWDDSIWKV